MKVGEVMKAKGSYVLTAHARVRIRQRVGIDLDSAAISWVKRAIENAKETFTTDNKTHYITDLHEIICDGVKVITVKPCYNANGYVARFKSVIEKETEKLLKKYEKEFRKAEIEVVQITLNLLRAKNPKTKESIERKLTEAVDWKCAIEDELKQIEKASKQYGVGAS